MIQVQVEFQELIIHSIKSSLVLLFKGPILYTQDPNFVITVPADVLAPRLSTGTRLTTKVYMFPSQFNCLSMISCSFIEEKDRITKGQQYVPKSHDTLISNQDNDANIWQQSVFLLGHYLIQ